MRSTCKECGGASICEHGRVRSTCKECGGASICEHGRRRSRCKECSPKLQAQYQLIMEKCAGADYATNKNEILAFVDEYAGEDTLSYVFFAGHGRYNDERKSNMDKLKELVKGKDKRMEDFDAHEIAVNFAEELPQEAPYPPKKAEGETFSAALGSCARTSALALEKEVVCIIDCNNKTGGGGGRPPLERENCSVATTSIIILVPRTQ